MLPDRGLFEEVAGALRVDPAFIEKDWYAMRLIALLVHETQDDVELVFSGGTSLSKGYGLIRRFSEDIDFKTALAHGDVGRSVRRNYRQQIVSMIRETSTWQLDDADVEAGNESRYFVCRVGYETAFKASASLRPHIKLEVSFTPPSLPTVRRPLHSFLGEARGDTPEVAQIACVAPAETAADKVSALTWRVLTRKRGASDDDPTLIRHLHDLGALEQAVSHDPAFPELLRTTLKADSMRGGPSPDVAAMTLSERLATALEKLSGDAEYRREYEQFALNMSYAEEGETPDFDSALEALHRLTKRL